MSNKTEFLSFEELARFHGLSLMKWDEDNYVSENTELAKDFFEAGQQTKQTEIDELQNRIESAMELLEYNEYVDSALQALEILKGYKLVLVEPTDVKLKEFQKIRFDSGCAHIMKKKKPIGLYKAMMGEESK